MIGEKAIVLEVSREEFEELLEVLGEHIYWGRIALQGEFDVVATGEYSPVAKALYHRLRRLKAQLEGKRP